MTWDKIKGLLGTEICVDSCDESMTWKVVECIERDDFSAIHNEELFMFASTLCILKDSSFNGNCGGTDVVDDDDIVECKKNEYNNIFWDLWPKSIHHDLAKLNKVIEKFNRERKEHYQRVSRPARLCLL